MTTQPFLNNVLFTTPQETNLHAVLSIYNFYSLFLNVQCNQ